jgi:hypothetical protein
VEIPDVYPSTSLSYDTLLVAQDYEGYIQGYNISFEAENTDILSNVTLGDGHGPVKGMLGTRIAITSLKNEKEGTTLYAFYQVFGDDITLLTRDTSGKWNSSKLQIPDDLLLN